MLKGNTDFNIDEIYQLSHWIEKNYSDMTDYPGQPIFDILEDSIAISLKHRFFEGLTGFVSFQFNHDPKIVTLHMVSEKMNKAFIAWLAESFLLLFNDLPQVEYIICRTKNVTAHRILEKLGGERLVDEWTIRVSLDSLKTALIPKTKKGSVK